mgnify:CR=1
AYQLAFLDASNDIQTYKSNPPDDILGLIESLKSNENSWNTCFYRNLRYKSTFQFRLLDMNLSGGDMLMRALREEGVKFIFGY